MKSTFIALLMMVSFLSVGTVNANDLEIDATLFGAEVDSVTRLKEKAVILDDMPMKEPSAPSEEPAPEQPIDVKPCIPHEIVAVVDKDFIATTAIDVRTLNPGGFCTKRFASLGEASGVEVLPGQKAIRLLIEYPVDRVTGYHAQGDGELGLNGELYHTYCEGSVVKITGPNLIRVRS